MARASPREARYTRDRLAGIASSSSPNASGLGRIVDALRLLWREPELRVVLFCSTLLGLAMSFVAPFLSMFGTLEVKMSLGLFGLFMTANACVNIVISTVISRRSDVQYSRRAVLLWAAGAGAIGYWGYALAREPWQLFLIGGFALGVASHGIGTARAFQVSEEMGAFAGLGMGLNGVFTAFVVPVLLPVLSKLL